MSEKNPWKNGIYASDGNTGALFKIEGTKVSWLPTSYYDFPDEVTAVIEGTVAFGDFGPTRDEVKEASGGVETNNFEMKVGHMGLKGVLNEEGNLIWAWGMWNRLEKVEFLSEDEIKKRSEEREDINECFCPYKIQPENKGKLVWLSGPPGAGKSTTGQLLGRNSGFVYYEADCAFSCLNPYVPVDVENPTLAGFLQKPVKGIGIEWVRVGKNVEKTFGDLMAGNFDVDWTTTYPFYTLMADFIKVQHNRVGGDFAVAQAVTSRAIRDVIRKTLPDVIFVILNLTKETQRKRVMERHGEGEEADGIAAFLAKMFQLYEGPADDEKNTLKVDITEEMTPEDVQKKVLEVLASSGL